MSVDFSHLRKQWPDMLGSAYARGVTLTDKDYLDAYNQVDPPLLPERESWAISRILQPARGRPPKETPSRVQLHERVLQTDRPDVSPLFVRALAERLSRERGLTWDQLHGRDYRKNERKWRRRLICYLYESFYDSQDGHPFIMHEMYGRIDVPMDISSRSERALAMTKTVMHDRLGMDMPSIETIRNIVSQENNSGPFS